jgi:hypothetical protein
VFWKYAIRPLKPSRFVDYEWLETQVVHPKLRFLAHVDGAGLT